MLYLLAFFFSPPLAVLLAGKPFQAVLNGVLYLGALFWAYFGLLIWMLFGVGHLFWGVGVPSMPGS